MILSERLSCILNMVDECGCIADIGTDHGYLVMEAVISKKAKAGIASDINKGPIARAEANIRSRNLDTKIQCRLGSGLSTIKSGEIDCAVVAGMGGNLIGDIIQADMDLVKEIPQIILQPSQNPEVLRKFLYGSGFEILDEDICYDNDIYYEIMKVRYTGNTVEKTELECEISKILMDKKNPLFGEYIKWKIDKNIKTLTYIDDSFERGMTKKNQLKEKNVVLEEKLNEFYGK